MEPEKIEVRRGDGFQARAALHPQRRPLRRTSRRHHPHRAGRVRHRDRYGRKRLRPEVKGERLVGVVLALVLVASLWWSYFDREDRRAADALVAAAP